jgi:hypothetical protein
VENSKGYIDALLICKTLGIQEMVTFCIDTGAHSTCLVERDAIDLGIDLEKLRKIEKYTAGIGGSADACFLDDVKLGFLDNDDKVWVASFARVPIIVSRKSVVRKMIDLLLKIIGKSEVETPRGLPSLLGFDFLKGCKISFSEKEAYLDVD